MFQVPCPIRIVHKTVFVEHGQFGRAGHVYLVVRVHQHVKKNYRKFARIILKRNCGQHGMNGHSDHGLQLFKSTILSHFSSNYQIK